MAEKDGFSRSGLAVVLTVVFFAALFMGAGPGLRLVNPNPDDPNATFVIFGLPIIYVWGVFWYGVQAAVVITAYFTVWAKKNDLKKDGQDA